MAAIRELPENMQNAYEGKESQNLEEIYKKALMEVVQQNDALKAKLVGKDNHISTLQDKIRQLNI